MLNIQHLKELVDFKELGTFSAVAERNFLSQPALTRNMKTLERELGIKLFERHANYVELTSAGKFISDKAETILLGVRELEKNIENIRTFGKIIKIGSCTTTTDAHLIRSLQDTFRIQEISVEYQDTEKLLNGLMDDTYQFVILPFESDDEKLQSVPYRTDHLMLSLSKLDSRSNSTGFSFSELNGESFFTHKLARMNNRYRELMPDSHFIVVDDSVFIQLLENSTLPIILPEHAIQNNLKPYLGGRVNIPIKDEFAEISYYIVFKKDLEKKYKTLSK